MGANPPERAAGIVEGGGLRGRECKRRTAGVGFDRAGGLAARGETIVDRVYHIDRGYEKSRELGSAARRSKF